MKQLTTWTSPIFLSPKHILHELESTNKVYFMIKGRIKKKKFFMKADILFIHAY